MIVVTMISEGMLNVLSPSTPLEKRNLMDDASYEEKIATFTVAIDDVK
jgi:hypothetical protein